MSMLDFARTKMGMTLFDGTLPSIAGSLKRIATALEAQTTASEALAASNNRLAAALEQQNAGDAPKTTAEETVKFAKPASVLLSEDDKADTDAIVAYAESLGMRVLMFNPKCVVVLAWGRYPMDTQDRHFVFVRADRGLIGRVVNGTVTAPVPTWTGTEHQYPPEFRHTRHKLEYRTVSSTYPSPEIEALAWVNAIREEERRDEELRELERISGPFKGG